MSRIQTNKRETHREKGEKEREKERGKHIKHHPMN